MIFRQLQRGRACGSRAWPKPDHPKAPLLTKKEKRPHVADDWNDFDNGDAKHRDKSFFVEPRHRTRRRTSAGQSATDSTPAAKVIDAPDRRAKASPVLSLKATSDDRPGTPNESSIHVDSQAAVISAEDAEVESVPSDAFTGCRNQSPASAATSTPVIAPATPLVSTPYPGQFIDVTVTWVEHLGEMSVILENDYEAIRTLSCHLSDSIMADMQPLPKFQVGSFVAANFEGEYYRARVLAINSDCVHVHFVDYGNTETVERVFQLPERFASARPRAAHRLNMTATVVGGTKLCAETEESRPGQIRRMRDDLDDAKVKLRVICGSDGDASHAIVFAPLTAKMASTGFSTTSPASGYYDTRCYMHNVEPRALEREHVYEAGVPLPLSVAQDATVKVKRVKFFRKLDDGSLLFGIIPKGDFDSALLNQQLESINRDEPLGTGTQVGDMCIAVMPADERGNCDITRALIERVNDESATVDLYLVDYGVFRTALSVNRLHSLPRRLANNSVARGTVLVVLDNDAADALQPADETQLKNCSLSQKRLRIRELVRRPDGLLYARAVLAESSKRTQKRKEVEKPSASSAKPVELDVPESVSGAVLNMTVPATPAPTAQYAGELREKQAPASLTDGFGNLLQIDCSSGSKSADTERVVVDEHKSVSGAVLNTTMPGENENDRCVSDGSLFNANSPASAAVAGTGEEPSVAGRRITEDGSPSNGKNFS